MTVKELIEQLQKYLQHLSVIQAIDHDGNGYWVNMRTELGYIYDHNEFFSEEEHADLENDGLCMCQKAVCVWPA